MTTFYAHKPEGSTGYWHIDEEGQTWWGMVATVWNDDGSNARLLAAAPALRDFLASLITLNLISDTTARADALALLASLPTQEPPK